MKTILYRADGSKDIGMGHLNRSSLVCQEFISNSNKTNLLMKQDSKGFLFINNKEISITELPTFKSMSEEIEFLSAQIKNTKTDILFLDILNHDEYNELLGICNKNNIITIVITDESEKMDNINADIVLNGNPNQLEYNYDNYSAKYLVGPSYFIMDNDYSIIENNQPNGEIRNILVTLGGSDHNNLLFDVLKVIDSIYENINIIIITTKASGYINRLKKLLNSLVNTTELYIDVNSISHYWTKCDIAITAGGNTLFERISTRTPGATVCQLERQMEISDCFMKLGVNYNIGMGAELSQNEMENNFRVFFGDLELHKQQYLNAKNVISGDGIKLMMEELHKIPISNN